MEPNLHPVILRFDSLDSTNTEASRQAIRGASEGLCIVAREQTAGRGRQQRVWTSLKDAGLYCSLVLRPRLETRSWPLITLMSALAVGDAMLETFELKSDIKWPNDIHVDGRKVCGILSETVETAVGRAVIVGIGVNLKSHAETQELFVDAISVEEATGLLPDSESLLSSLISAMARRYMTLHQLDGREEILKEWTARSSYAEGMRVRVTLEDEILEGVTRGLASDGALRVQIDEGDIRLVHAGDVTALRSVS